MMKIARIALAFGLLTPVSAEVYAACFVLNAKELRNDLSWLYNRGAIHLSLSTWPLSQEETSQALKKAQPSHSSEQVSVACIKQRLSSLKSPFRASDYSSTDKPRIPQRAGQIQQEDSLLSLAFNNIDECWHVHLQDNVEDYERISKDSRFNANSADCALKFWDQWLLFGQIIGEEEAGGPPSDKTFIGGGEGHHGLGEVAINWYVKTHDTSSNMTRTNYIFTHHIYKDGFYQQCYPLGDAIGGDGQLFAGKVELVKEDNQSINMVLTHSDTSKVI